MCDEVEREAFVHHIRAWYGVVRCGANMAEHSMLP